MSKIMIAMTKPIEDTRFTMALKQLDPNWSLVDLKKKLIAGKNGFFFCCELFLNDHQEKDQQIRGIISLSNTHGHELHIVEIPYNTQWADFTLDELNANHLISTQMLVNILDDATENFN